MYSKFFRWLLPAAVGVAVSVAAAQKPGPTPPDPLDAAASVPPITYQSTLQKHRRLSDDNKPVPWREANDTVGHIGGWRAYAREANEPAANAADAGMAPTTGAAAMPAAAASAPSRSMPAGHGAHRH